MREGKDERLTESTIRPAEPPRSAEPPPSRGADKCTGAGGLDRTDALAQAQALVEHLRARARVYRRVVVAAQAWDTLGMEKALHVLTCAECERLEQVEDRWCPEAGQLGRRQLEAGKEIQNALKAARIALGIGVLGANDDE